MWRVAVLAARPDELCITSHFHFNLMATSLKRRLGNIGNHVAGQKSPVIESSRWLIGIGPSSCARPYAFEMVAQIIPRDARSRWFQSYALNVLLYAVLEKMEIPGNQVANDNIFPAIRILIDWIIEIILTVQLRIKRLIEDHGGDENLIGFDADGILRGNNCN